MFLQTESWGFDSVSHPVTVAPQSEERLQCVLQDGLITHQYAEMGKSFTDLKNKLLKVVFPFYHNDVIHQVSPAAETQTDEHFQFVRN